MKGDDEFERSEEPPAQRGAGEYADEASLLIEDELTKRIEYAAKQVQMFEVVAKERQEDLEVAQRQAAAWQRAEGEMTAMLGAARKIRSDVGMKTEPNIMKTPKGMRVRDY